MMNDSPIHQVTESEQMIHSVFQVLEPLSFWLSQLWTHDQLRVWMCVCACSCEKLCVTQGRTQDLIQKGAISTLKLLTCEIVWLHSRPCTKLVACSLLDLDVSSVCRSGCVTFLKWAS